MSTFEGYQTSTYVLKTSEIPFTNEGTIFGTIGESGLVANEVPIAEITNLGNLEGGTDSSGILIGKGTITNDLNVLGGIGGSSGYQDFGYYGVGSGGNGVTSTQFVRIYNSGVVAGNDGGFARYAYSSGGSPIGDAGNGGTGLYFQAGGQVVNSGTVQGGAGGGASEDSAERNGSGGAGIRVVGYGRINNSGYIIGGGTDGTHGKGGDGVDLTSGGTLVDSGLIEGGDDPDGIGGAGVTLGASGSVTLEQNGVIRGGESLAGNQSAGIILNGGTLTTAGTIAGGSSSSYSVLFEGTSPTRMSVSDGASFRGGIGGFKYGDTIDLTNLAPSYVESHFNLTTDTITTEDGILSFVGDPTLLFSVDSVGGTLVTTPCFRRGTLILAQHGERLVETLEIGDRVLTKDRELKDIRWIGRRHYAGPTLVGRRDILPVLIKAGALGDELPRRDLWVSPEHAMYFDGALVPAGLLTNGASILTDDSVSSVSYYHLEFDEQEVIFAEGAAAESFVDDDSRLMFDNAADYARRYPAAPHKAAIFCAPRIEEGEALEVLRGQLAAIARIAAQYARPTASVRELRA